MSDGRIQAEKHLVVRIHLRGPASPRIGEDSLKDRGEAAFDSFPTPKSGNPVCPLEAPPVTLAHNPCLTGHVPRE